jgi:hypothetical protein
MDSKKKTMLLASENGVRRERSKAITGQGTTAHKEEEK